MKDIVRAAEEIKKVIQGKDSIINSVMLAILSGGHILLEDVPGVGKTTLALAFSRVLGLDYKRVQFTPDVMPSDVTGFSMYNKRRIALTLLPEQQYVICCWQMKLTVPRLKPRRRSLR